MRKSKTAEKNRINYVYYTAAGKKIFLTPGDVGDEWIAYLHDADEQNG